MADYQRLTRQIGIAAIMIMNKGENSFLRVM